MIVAAGLTAILAMNGSSLAVLGILLPTLIHVSLFTLVFMVLGAIRSGSKMQWVLVAALSGGHRDPACAAAVRRDTGSGVRQGRRRTISETWRRRSDGCSASPA